MVEVLAGTTPDRLFHTDVHEDQEFESTQIGEGRGRPPNVEEGPVVGPPEWAINQSVMAKSVMSNRSGLPFVSTISTP